MVKKVFFPILLIVSVFTLFACDRLDQTKTEVSNKVQEIGQKIDSKITEEKNKLNPEPTLTDTELEKELNNSTEPNIDQDLNDLEKALQE